MKFLTKIPDSLTQIDSLKAALYVQTYKNACTTYQIATITWICAHTDSDKSPDLIRNWWPKKGWKLIYNALSDNVKKGEAAEYLRKMIENHSKTQ
jgi:hypothetical protein